MASGQRDLGGGHPASVCVDRERQVEWESFPSRKVTPHPWERGGLLKLVAHVKAYRQAVTLPRVHTLVLTVIEPLGVFGHRRGTCFPQPGPSSQEERGLGSGARERPLEEGEAGGCPFRTSPSS